MDKTTSETILEMILKLGPISASRIASRLNLSPADIRYHVTRLLRMGLIASVGPNESQNRGRPAARYVSTTSIALYGNNPVLETLMGVFSSLMQSGNTDTIHKSINQVFSLSKLENLNRVQRIIAAIGVFQQKGYQAAWEARPSAPIVVLHRCPYITWLPAYPELCEFDRTALEITLGYPIKKIRTRTDQMDMPCQFSVFINS